MKNRWVKQRSSSNRVKAWILRLSLTTLSLSGILIIIFLIWKVPEQQTKNIENRNTPNKLDSKDYATIENTLRATLIQTLGGLFFFVTAYFSFQNLKVTQEKQVTERFAKAIEQLGNENIHVRLGAIYALERIAKDSDRDYWQVMEVLTAYLRERSPYPSREQTNNPHCALQFETRNNYKIDKTKKVRIIKKRMTKQFSF